MLLRLLLCLSPLCSFAIPVSTEAWQKQYEQWVKAAPPTRLDGVAWSDNDEWLTYLHKNENNQPTWYLVHCTDGVTRPALDSTALKAAFKNLAPPRQPSLNFQRVIPQNDGQLRLENNQEAWLWDGQSHLTSTTPSKDAGNRNNGRTAKNAGPEKHLNFSRTGGNSPDGQWQVSFREGNVWVESKSNNTVARALTTDGKPEDSYTGTIQWAPDSRHFAVWKEHRVTERRYTVVNSVKNTKEDIPYEKPGDDRTTRVAYVFELPTGTSSHPTAEILPPCYETHELAWTSDSTRLRTEYVERGFTGHGILEYDVRTHQWRPLLVEHDPKFVYTFAQRYRYDLNEDSTLWTSERSGYLHLYRIDFKTGKSLALTQGNWVMKQVQSVDDKSGEILFLGLGRNPDENPYYQHLCKVTTQGSAIIDLTPGDAHHTFELSPHRRYLIDTASRVDQAPSFTLRSAQDGKSIKALATESLKSLEAAGWQAPIRFHTTDRNNQYEIWGVINRPYPFDPKQKYPVIEHIYAGPQDSFAPRSFSPWIMNHREPTLHGFYVVQIDGLGTFNRGKAFHQVCWHNLKDAGFPDRIKWMQAAAKIETAMDLSRVGIFGGSAGGQNTAHALLNFGAFYKAGAADCGCYDNRIDKLWWNEQWMGYPLGPWYAQNSCATDAAKLTGHLFLSVGESDTNVDVKCTYDLRDALLAAGKKDLFELHVVPGANHGACERGDMREKRLQFFINQLHPPGA